MTKTSKKLFALLGLIFSGLFKVSTVKAVCPICVVAVGAGLGLSKWLGVDDAVSSIWIGALLAATSLWTLIWLQKKNWNFKFDKIVIFLSYYLLTLVPLYYAGIIGHPLNTIISIDKIIFGVTIGTVVVILINWWYLHLKQKNNGRAHFPYEKVIMPVVFLLLISIILWMIV